MAQPTTITPSNFMESAAPDRGTTLRYKPVGTRGKKITTGMMAVPPHQRCVGSAPSSPPDLWCLLMMLVMKIGTIQALGVPPLRGVLGLLPAPLGGPGVFTPMSPSKV